MSEKITCNPKALTDQLNIHAMTTHNLRSTVELAAKMIKHCIAKQTRQHHEKNGKEKRPPSPYNLHMKECIPTQQGSHTEKFSKCVAIWREKHGKKEDH